MKDDESPLEAAFEAYLGRLTTRARALRDEASAALERGARQAAGLGWSQRRIAGALGRSQPEIKRLLDRASATGTGPPSEANDESVSMLDVVLCRRRDEIVATAARYGARNVRVFGSVVAGNDTSRSGIDLLVDVGPKADPSGLSALESELEDLLGRPVDIVLERSLRPGVRAAVDAIQL